MEVFVRFRSAAAALSLDLLAGIAILTVLLGISLPAVSSISKELKLNREALIIQSHLESLVSKSAEYNRKASIHLQNNSLYIIQEQEDEEIIYSHKLPDGFHLEFSPAVAAIRFYSGGVCSPASFHLNNGANTCAFILSLRCRISLSC